MEPHLPPPSSRRAALLGALAVLSLCASGIDASAPPSDAAAATVPRRGGLLLERRSKSKSLPFAAAATAPSGTRPALGGREQARRPDLVAVGSGSSGWKAAGGVAGLALASEALQLFNTFVGVFVLNRVTGATSLADLVEAFANTFGGLGLLAYPVYVLLLHTITILPLMSAILFIVLAGTVFGPIKGTLMVSLSLSSAAAISATVSRKIARKRSYTLANIDPRAQAVDVAISQKPWHTSLLLVLLLRLSPVLPFTFSNYLAGLTSIPIPTFFLGTLLGTLPTQAVYVAAGSLGRRALQGGVKLPWPVVALGVAATVLAIVFIGHVATATLKGMDLESTGGGGKASKGKRSA